MGAYIREEHMAVGDWELDVDYSPELAALAFDDEGKVHVLFYDADDDLVYTGVLLRAEGDENGLKIGGRNLLWYLGTEEEGPLIVDREFVSGANKLANPGFEDDLEHEGLLKWSVPADSKWRQAIGHGRTGWGAAWVEDDPYDDDVLQSEESWEAREGESYSVGFWARRPTGAVGRVRARAVLTGRFKHPNLLTHNWYPAVVVNPADIEVLLDDLGGKEIRFHPVTPLTHVANDDFAGLAGWTALSGSWGTFSGPNGVDAVTDALAGDPYKKLLYATGDGTLRFPVQGGERWRFSGWCAPFDTATDGIGIVTCKVTTDAAGPETYYEEILRYEANGHSTDWRYASRVFPIPEDFPFKWLSPGAEVHGHTAGRWSFNYFHLIREAGNHNFAWGDPITVPNSGQEYVMAAAVTTTATVTDGRIVPGLKCEGPGREPVILEGPPMDRLEPDSVFALEWRVRIPSGYNFVSPFLRATDTHGGIVSIRHQSFRIADDTHHVGDAPSAPSGAAWTVVSGAVTCPRGTERVHMEIVAEQGAGGWLVDDAALARYGEPGWTVADVARELLKEPDTGAALSLGVGTISGSEILPADWRIRNRTLRACLNHLCTVIAPGYEYRVIHSTRTLDLGPPEIVFVDHAPGTAAAVVLVPRDLDVAAIPGVAKNTEEKVNNIRLVGGTRESSTGLPSEIVATASLNTPVELDWDGRPIRRTRVVEDSTVDHLTYANARVAGLAADEANEPYSIEVTLRGRNTRPDVKPGEWVYVYHPEAGLVDRSGAYETEVDGEPVFPKRVRVLGMTRRLGPSYRAELRRPDGTTLALGRVRWETEDGTDMTIGHRPLSFATDPNAGAAAKQYMRFRVSSPR